METLSTQWLVMVMNGVVIALVLTFPLLLGMIIMRIFRKGVSRDRHEFEDEVISKLGEMSSTLAEIQKLLEKQSGNN